MFIYKIFQILNSKFKMSKGETEKLLFKKLRIKMLSKNISKLKIYFAYLNAYIRASEIFELVLV